MYLGMTILLSGLAIVSSNMLSALLVILFILHVRIVFIRREEIMLEE